MSGGLTTWWRAIGRGAAVIAVSAVIAAVHASLEWTIVALLATVAIGILGGMWAGEDSDSAFGMTTGALLFSAVGVVLVMITDVPVLGTDAGSIALVDAPHHRFAAQFHFPDARVAGELAAVVDIRSRGGGALFGTWRAAPIVPASWSSGDPVTAWALAETSIHDRAPGVRSARGWSEPYRAGARHVASDTLAEDAVRRAIERHGLTSAPGAPRLFWVADPAAMIAERRRTLAWISLGSVAAWALVLIAANIYGYLDDLRRPR